MSARHHASLSSARWARFSLDQQILMIGNEMNRARKHISAVDRSPLRGSYEAILRLVDLTVEVHARRSLRRELLRWRDVIAELYLAEAPDPAVHDRAFRCLLYLTPEASRQIAPLGL